MLELMTRLKQKIPWPKKRQGNVTEEIDLRIASPFEAFLHKAANITRIWKTILSNVTGTDVANCLKVCRKLRFAIGQSLDSSSSFKQEMDIAASASAISNGWIKSKTNLRPEKISSQNPSKVIFFDLGRRWQPFDEREKPILIGQQGKMLRIGFPKITNIFVPKAPKYVYAQYQRRLVLLQLENTFTEDIFDEEAERGFEKIPQEPYCIRYRLLAMDEHSEDRVTIMMKLLNSSGAEVKTISLYHLVGNSIMDLSHTASNEEVKIFNLYISYLATSKKGMYFPLCFFPLIIF